MRNAKIPLQILFVIEQDGIKYGEYLLPKRTNIHKKCPHFRQTPL